MERSFFVGVINGKADSVAFESTGKGFGGAISMMVGVNIADDKIIGVGVTTHSKTPGVGSKAQTDPAFSKQFKGMVLKDEFKVKPDGGKFDALSGATVTSRGVVVAVTEAAKIYGKLKPQLAEKTRAVK